MNMLNTDSKIHDIKSLKVQGAKEVALASLDILENVLKKEGRGRKFEEMCSLLQDIRPTAVVTYNVIEALKESPSLKTIQEIKEYMENSQKKINEQAYETLTKYSSIMTHCHSSEELKALMYAKEHGHNFKVYITETRPKMQGLKSARELLKAGIDVVYIVDSATGFFVNEVDAFLFGIDSIREDGIYNKIGTYMMALVAKDKGKNVHFIGDVLKIDKRPEINVEMRSPQEVLPSLKMFEIIDNRKEVEDLTIKNPAFDLTPWKLVDSVITDKGSFRDWNEIKNKTLFS